MVEGKREIKESKRSEKDGGGRRMDGMDGGSIGTSQVPQFAQQLGNEKRAWV